jgi:hypothetical protein
MFRTRILTPALLVMLSFVVSNLHAQLSSSFELRYFSKEKSANGITDFKGETEVFDSLQRIEFLNRYARIASRWFMDSALNRQVVEDDEVKRFLEDLKSQPLPEKRKRIVLNTWKTTGALRRGAPPLNGVDWQHKEGLETVDGTLHMTETSNRLHIVTDTLLWRMQFNWSARSDEGNVPLAISLMDGSRILAEAGFHSNGNIFYTENGNDRMGMSYRAGDWYAFKLEVDLVNNRYNLFVNDHLVGDWASLRPAEKITGIRITGGRDIYLDDVWGLAYDTTGCEPRQPYRIIAMLREDFQEEPDMTAWYDAGYDDSEWETTALPVVHGGALEAGEDLYLRTTIKPGAVKRAFLNSEALDPGGEIWINGEVVHVTRERHPVRIDISDLLIPFKENQLAIRVYSSFVEGPLYHSPLDRNFGWFCGRTWIDLTEEIYLGNAFAFTAALDKGSAVQHHLTALINDSDTTFTGYLEISYSPWFPEESRTKAASKVLPVTVFARDSIHLRNMISVNAPLLWTHDRPSLYRIHIKLKHQDRLIDDLTFTTGIRTVSQEGGTFRINGQPELLGGAQTMGFRMPIENLAKWNRCAPDEVLAEELMSVKRMGNTLRIHVHSAGTYAYSVNDPRVAEMADQLGIMLIWPTSSWIRAGEWGGIDFEGYPMYMRQVFNHPSIVIWEGANHPNRFDGKSLEYSNRFITKIYRTIYDTDSSRLVSPTSYNRHFEYRNDEGTIDKKGNSIVPCKEWTAPNIVRGNQDALTGYGSEWHKIRNFPDPYRKSFLDSPERAYVNFEHEESIGMQNFDLARGKPWYQMPSYENPYDVGSIGREFTYAEWRESQAWQAFSAYESMKWQRIKDVDGFSWCCLHGGPNSGTYRKPVIDALGHAKLSFYANRMALQDVLASSNNTDVVYGKKDRVTPVILNVGEERTVDVKVSITNLEGEELQTETYSNILLPGGRSVTEIPPFKPALDEEGYYVVNYFVLRK